MTSRSPDQRARVRRALLATTAVMAVQSVGSLAHAQQTAAPTPPASATPAAQPASAPATQLNEVVVTAERRETNLQRTAAALEVLGAPALQRQRVVEFTDLNSVLNNTQILPANLATQVSIRGIGSNFVDSRADPGVAISINGLFYTRPLPVGFGFLDVSRVEVLEGPQGTLYGRNSAAGAINIITNQPTQRFGGMVQASFGNLNERDFTGVLNVPVTDTLAVRVAYDRDMRDGYISDYYDDKDSTTGRISARWTPTDKLTVYVESDYLQLGGHGNAPESYPCPGSQAWVANVPPACAVFGPGGAFASGGQEKTYVESDQVHLDYNLGFATLTSITGFVGTHEQLVYPNGSLFRDAYRTDNTDYSEEIRLAGHDTASHKGGLAWQVGTFLFNSTGDSLIGIQVPMSNIPPTGTGAQSKLPQSSEAGYAQLTYGVTNRLRVTGGVRYTHDAKGVVDSSTSYAPPFFQVVGPPTVGAAHTSDYRVTYKGGIEYDLAPGKLLYGTISTGYVAGGVNGGDQNVPLVPEEAPAVFKPETITAYEVGSKNRFLDNRLQLNAAFYYYDFHNYQYSFPSLIQSSGFLDSIEIQNAGAVTAYGLELTSEFAPTRADRFSASLGLTHATFGTLQFAGFSPPFTTFEENTPSGSDVVNAPRWSALLGYEHTWRLDNNSSVTFGANTKLSAKYLLIVASTLPSDTQGGYAMTDANVAYHWDENKYVIRLWAKNLENVPVNVYGEGLGFQLYDIEPPRTYGVTLTANF